MEATRLKKGSSVPNRDKVAKLTWDQVATIAQEKMPDLNTKKLHSAMKMVAGTARSMGIDIEGTPPWENNN